MGRHLSVDQGALDQTLPEGGTLQYGPKRTLTCACCILTVVVSFQHRSTAEGAEGFLGRMRDNVRGVPSGVSAPAPQRPARAAEDNRRRNAARHSSDVHGDHGNYGDLYMLGLLGAAAAVASPYWGPYALLGDDLHTKAYFPSFPYENVPGYMIPAGSGIVIDSYDRANPDLSSRAGNADDPLLKYMEKPLNPYHDADGSPSVNPRNWSGRIRFEYADAFDETSRMGSQMLLSTSSRFGLDMEMNRFREDLGGPAVDELWLGDFNFVYRFAQSERAQFRTGLGINWFDDPIQTDIGFNFTYGADFFPQKPWILSATLDWGTVGSAELFRFRTSVGLIIHRVEVYSGYEYLDIDNSQINALMAGLRVWF
jgi:hypothetical protein